MLFSLLCYYLVTWHNYFRYIYCFAFWSGYPACHPGRGEALPNFFWGCFLKGALSTCAWSEAERDTYLDHTWLIRGAFWSCVVGAEKIWFWLKKYGQILAGVLLSTNNLTQVCSIWVSITFLKAIKHHKGLPSTVPTTSKIFLLLNLGSITPLTVVSPCDRHQIYHFCRVTSRIILTRISS